jgi:hypothetical protein
VHGCAAVAPEPGKWPVHSRVYARRVSRKRLVKIELGSGYAIGMLEMLE